MSPRFRATETEPLAQLEEMRTMLAETVPEWTKDWVAQGREEGREEGRAEERRLLCRLAARKFDARAAGRLATALSDVVDPERLAQVGEWIIECETAADLIVPARAGLGGRDLRRGDRLPLPARRQRRELAAPPHRAQRGGQRLQRAITGAPVADCTSGFRRWRRDALRCIPLDRLVSNGYAFLIETLHEALRRGARIGEVSIVFVERRHGRSKVSPSALAESLLMPWRVRFRPRVR